MNWLTLLLCGFYVWGATPKKYADMALRVDRFLACSASEDVLRASECMRPHFHPAVNGAMTARFAKMLFLDLIVSKTRACTSEEHRSFNVAIYDGALCFDFIFDKRKKTGAYFFKKDKGEVKILNVRL